MKNEENEHFGEKFTKRWEIMRRDDVPEWLQNSKFIFNWYRPPLQSYRVSSKENILGFRLKFRQKYFFDPNFG